MAVTNCRCLPLGQQQLLGFESASSATNERPAQQPGWIGVGGAVLLLALAGLLPEAASAQGSGFAPVDVTVDVVTGLSVFRERDLNFGTVVAGTGVYSVAVTSVDAGLFRIYGRRNRRVDVTLTPPATLGNGTHTIPYSWQAAYNESANDPSTATAAGSTTFSVQLLEHVAPAPAGQAWVWIHGSIDVGTAPSALSGGTYTGIFTLSAVYQ